MLYFIENYYTDEIIDITDDFDKACRICYLHNNSIVTTETDEVLYMNIDIPF